MKNTIAILVLIICLSCNSNKNIASNSKGNYFHDVGDAHSFNDYFQSYTLNDDGFLTKE
ncbi:MAG: hypothetical protein ACJARX_000192 [Psychroserpens sp.]|jgi:hypothetical protein